MRSTSGQIRAFLPVVFLALLTVAAALGSVATRPSRATARAFSTTSGPTTTTTTTEPMPTLCGTVNLLTLLTVTRTNPAAADHITFSFPAVVSSTNAPAIAAVAEAACHAPTQPTGLFSCPADFGISYALTFMAGEHVVGTITADPTGCLPLRGLGATRTATSAFWAELAVALGLPAPREYCDPFRGRLANEPVECGPLIQ